MPQMTPMKRLNSNFKILKELMIDYEYFTLNKSASKSIPYPFEPKDRITGEYKSYTKGVENDFLLIFNKIDADLSIGFVINYLNEYDNPKFKVTIKFGGSNECMRSSEEMDMEQFRTKLNELNKQLINEKSYALELISQIFLNEEYDLNKYLEMAEAEIEHDLGDEYSSYIELVNSVNADKESLKNCNEEIEENLKALDEYKDVEKLRTQLAEAEKKLSEKRSVFEKNMEIEKLQSNIQEQEKKVKYIGFRLLTKLNKLKGKFPRIIGDKIRSITKQN